MDTTDDDDASRDAFVRAGWVNVAGNALKIGVEGSLGLAFGSVALLADAAHSLADLLASVVVLVWGRLSFADADSTHPHGHQRIEPLTALFVGASISLIALVLLRDAVLKIFYGTEVRFSLLLVGGLAFAVVDMFAVYWYTRTVNQKIGSPGLRALAKDCLNDIYTSAAAVVGVLGLSAGYPVLDPVAGGFVSILVLYQGIEIGRENIDYLVGSAPSDEKQEEILDTVYENDAVRGVHDFTAHYVGHEIEVEMHVEIDGDYTIREAHDIETDIHETVKALPDVGDVHVHLDPAGIGEWKSVEESHETGLTREGSEG